MEEEKNVLSEQEVKTQSKKGDALAKYNIVYFITSLVCLSFFLMLFALPIFKTHVNLPADGEYDVLVHFSYLDYVVYTVRNMQTFGVMQIINEYLAAAADLIVPLILTFAIVYGVIQEIVVAIGALKALTNSRLPKNVDMSNAGFFRKMRGEPGNLVFLVIVCIILTLLAPVFSNLNISGEIVKFEGFAPTYFLFIVVAVAYLVLQIVKKSLYKGVNK